MGQEKRRYDDPGKKISENYLKKAEVTVKGNGGSSNYCEGAGFRGNDGEGYGPPGYVTSAEEVVLESLLFVAKARSKPSDPDEIQ